MKEARQQGHSSGLARGGRSRLAGTAPTPESPEEGRGDGVGGAGSDLHVAENDVQGSDGKGGPCKGLKDACPVTPTPGGPGPTASASTIQAQTLGFKSVLRTCSTLSDRHVVLSARCRGVHSNTS